MKSRVLTTTALLSAFAGALPAADPQLMKLVMPDVKVMSDVNVLQAKLSPFGQYVLSQVEDGQLQQLAAATGFDPRQDLMELMLVSNGTAGASGAANSLALASGVFNPAKIAEAVTANGIKQETYKGVMIVDIQNSGAAAKTGSIAFLNGSIMLAGSAANVKAAIDRQAAPATLPPSLVTQANELSVTYDAWVLSTVSPAAFASASEGKAEAIAGMKIPLNSLQQVQSGYLGVKFGANVALGAQVQSDTEENAAGLAGMLQLLGNIAQMQTAQNPNAAAFAKSLTVSAKGSSVNISASVPEAQFQQLLRPKAAVKGHVQGERK
jgi:hypothetical protein